MLRYIARRLLQMIPTMFGVILVTFLLFNWVGGSPARMKLGDKASPAALEEFDEIRGFNKPLIWGRYVKTRALPDVDFDLGPGGWAAGEGAVWHGEVLRVPAGVPLKPPFAFEPPRDRAHEWRIRWRNPGEKRWRVERVPVARGDAAADALTRWRNDRELELGSVALRRVVDAPWDSQLFFFLKQLARLDFGVSSSANQPVRDLLLDGIGPTISLALPILMLETALAISLGLYSAVYRGRLPDRILVIGSVALMSVNYLVWIVAGQYVLAFRLGWFPVWGFESFAYLLLPILVGVVSGLGAGVRFYRTILLEELNKDYVRTAYAKGLSRARVLFVHVLRNAAAPIITQVVLSLPFLYTGSLLLESFFGIPGLGYLSVNAINESDVDVVRAVVVIGSALYLVANLIADVLCAAADPRVKLS
ncbi:MAG: ABC transporter permease [Kiritimatiellae bacterium]|nr:ABC transporter permease [Kiritimatiellia bacterium]MDW8459131.1 ABC transporter permease [Verrucomicrobiota bacterium]